jgi:hypothetical protein
MSYATRTGLARVVLFALAAGLLAFGITPAKGADATFTADSQGWWRKAGIVVPSQVGEHVHLQVTIPADGVVTNGTISVPYVIRAHDTTGRITSFRVSDGSTVKQKWTIALGPCHDCTVSGTVAVNLGSWPTGRREMRWTANIPDNAEGNRQYQSTGYQVCVRSCTPSYRSGTYIEARGWYDDGHDYANARLTSPVSGIRSGGTIRVALKPGSGGSPTRLAGVYLDPDFHAGSAGRTVLQRTGAYEGNVTLPSISSGSHRLVLVSSDGQNAGVLALPFTVP